jgi:HSP20 family protein
MSRYLSSNNLLNIMDGFFDDFSPVTFVRPSSTPALNVEEYDDRYEINLAIAGINPEKVTVELSNKNLTISYQHNEENQEADAKGKMLRQEYNHYSFTRSVTLPKDVDETSIEAESSHGILKVIVQKIPEVQPKVVQVKVRTK